MSSFSQPVTEYMTREVESVSPESRLPDVARPMERLNISLPFEQFANPYVSRDRNFEFHYFFMRKFWFAYLAKALVIFPGGFGTHKRVGLQTIAPTSWGINSIVELLLYSPLDTVFSIRGGDVELVEAEIPQSLVGRMVRDLTVPTEMHIVSITRANKTFLPHPSTVFQEGDLIQLAIVTASADHLKELLGY